MDVQKKCKCKKTKCLKLYCDCFKAGLYCGESCSCQDCYNTPDYEDTVDVAREVIQLRDPLAFSHNGGENEVIPSVAKHSKGCNCRKSMCVKKYCECYLANVGCGSECRCEGCKNVFGKKEYHAYNKVIHKTVKEELECNGSGFYVPEFCSPQISTPRTPFQHLGHGKDVLSTGRYIPAQGSANRDMMFGRGEDFDVGRLGQPLYQNVEFMNQFTPMPSLPPLMDCPNGSRTSGNYSSAGSLCWNGSPVTPVTLFGGPEITTLMQSTEIPFRNNTF